MTRAPRTVGTASPAPALELAPRQLTGSAYHPGAPAPALILIRRLEANVDAISQAMLNQVRREFATRAYGPDLATQRAAVRVIADAFLATARDNRSLSAGERARVAGVGAAAVRLGVEQSTMLAAIRLAGRIAWLYAAEEARELHPESLAVSALQQLGLLLFNYVTEVCDLVAAGDAADRPRLEDAAAATAAVELMRGTLLDPDELLRRAADAGYAVDSLWGALLVFSTVATSDEAMISDAARTAVAHVQGGALVDVLGGSEPHAVLLAPVGNASQWQGIVGRAGQAVEPLLAQILAAPAAAGLLAVPQRYRRMRSLLPIASWLPVRTNVQWESSLAVYQLLGQAGEDEREHLVTSVLGPVLALPPARRDVLLHTLDLVESHGGRAAAAAEALRCHPKTVQYRVHRAYELAGLDQRNSGDRFRVQLALQALRWAAATRAAPGSSGLLPGLAGTESR